MQLTWYLCWMDLVRLILSTMVLSNLRGLTAVPTPAVPDTVGPVVDKEQSLQQALPETKYCHLVLPEVDFQLHPRSNPLNPNP